MRQALAAITLPYGLKVIPVQTIATPYFDWRYNGRIDHHINDKNTFSFSYSNQNNTRIERSGGLHQRRFADQLHHQSAHHRQRDRGIR